MTECANVRPCPRPLCGAELCDTHQPTCLYCFLHDEHGAPLPDDPDKYANWPKPSWFRRVWTFIEYRLVHGAVCIVVGHDWRSFSVVGHGGGPVIYYTNHCHRCSEMTRTQAPLATSEVRRIDTHADS